MSNESVGSNIPYSEIPDNEKLRQFRPYTTITFEEMVLVFESIGIALTEKDSRVFNDPKYEVIRKYFPLPEEPK